MGEFDMSLGGKIALGVITVAAVGGISYGLYVHSKNNNAHHTNNAAKNGATEMR
jgi:hypothetical protein